MTAQSSSTSVEQQALSTVELPPGVRHHTTTCFAVSDEAYDALSVEDGWEERGWAVDRCDTYPIGWHLQKEAEIRGCLIVAFPPKQPGRQVEQVVRDILAESMTPPVTPQEDEAWNALERERGWKASSDA